MKKIVLRIKELIYLKPILAIGIFSLIFFFLGGLALFFLNNVNNENVTNKNKPERQKYSSYKFTSPLLDCDYEGGPFAIRANDMKNKILKIIDENIKNGKAEHISVYFRDLSNGPTMGLGEDELFTPASLLKVPIMIAYLKKAETNPEILKKKITYEAKNINNELSQNIKPELTLEDGKEYTVEDLIKRMISYSDNLANGLLLSEIDDNFLSSIYTDLGIKVPITLNTENFMTVKEYAAFFRILYNSSYLNREMSEKALLFLSESSYNNGLRAGVPENVAIAHKFGERVFENTYQLHDCGIIYHTKSPYILCLMSRGNNFNNLENIIKDISKNVYEEVNKE